MSRQGWVECTGANTKDGSQLTGTTPTSILPADRARITLQTNEIDSLGKAFRIRAWGKLSSAASSPGTITFDVRFGAVIAATSQAISLATSLSNNTWIVEWDLIARTVGNSTSATMIHCGKAIGVTATAGLVQIPATSPAAGTGFDSTASLAVDFFVTFSSSSASNLITCNGFIFENLN